jgi:N-glycosylase/DNA lyase
MGDQPQGILEAPGEDRMSKTKMTSMAAAIAGALYTVARLMGYPIPIPEDVAIAALGSALALGQYFLRRAL